MDGRRRRRPDLDIPRDGRPPTTEEARKATDREDAEDLEHDIRERKRQRLKDEGWGGSDPEKRDQIISEYVRRCRCGFDHPKGCECGAAHPPRCTCKIPPWASTPDALHEEIKPSTHGVTKTSDKKSGRKRKRQKKRTGPVPLLYQRPHAPGT